MSEHTFLDIVQKYIMGMIGKRKLRREIKGTVLFEEGKPCNVTENSKIIFNTIVRKLDGLPRDAVILDNSAREELVGDLFELISDYNAKRVMERLHIAVPFANYKRLAKRMLSGEELEEQLREWAKKCIEPPLGHMYKHREDIAMADKSPGMPFPAESFVLQQNGSVENAAERVFALATIVTGHMSKFTDDEDMFIPREMVEFLGYTDTRSQPPFVGGRYLVSEETYLTALEKLGNASYFTHPAQAPVVFTDDSLRAHLEEFANSTEHFKEDAPVQQADAKLRNELREWGTAVFFKNKELSDVSDAEGRIVADALFSPLKLSPQITEVRTAIQTAEGLSFFALHALLKVYKYIRDNPGADPFIRLAFYHFAQKIRVLFI